MAQSATDLGCAPEDFIKDKNIIVESTTSQNARKYLKLPFICDLVSYGNCGAVYKQICAGALL